LRSRSAALDQSFCKSAEAAEAALEASHAAVIALVIIAEQMQQAVQGEHTKFGG